MFPFHYIPTTIDPTLRKIIIALMSIQIIAFLILMVWLTYDYIKQRNNPQPQQSEKDKDNKDKAENKDQKESNEDKKKK